MRLVFRKTKRLCAHFTTHLAFAVGLCSTVTVFSVQAQTVTGPPMVLKPSSLLQETINGGMRK